jgi:hypothetical protein
MKLAIFKPNWHVAQAEYARVAIKKGANSDGR